MSLDRDQLASAQPDVAHQVDELAEPLLVEAGAGVVLRQHALEAGLSRSMAIMASSTMLADGRLRRVGLEVRPARLLRHPEDVDGAVLVRVLGVGPLGPLALQLGVLLLERVGDVLEEDQAEHDVLVLGGVHVVAQGVGGGPQLGLEAKIRRGVVLLCPGSCHSSPFLNGSRDGRVCGRPRRIGPGSADK